MSDVIVSVVESNTNVTVTEQDVAVAVTENTVEVSASTAGIQGIPGANTDPIYVTVRNATGATLAKGTIVYISGSNGNHVQVTPAIATSDATSARTLGWLAASIANNASGLCQIEGYLEGLNTQGLTSGSQLYLSGTTAGAFTATKPVAPIHLVYVGVVTKISAGDGHVFVKVQNGYELGELHDVLITSPTNAQVLAYDSATSLWKNATNTPDGVTSITATAPLTGGTITSTGSIGLNQSLLSITKSQVSDFTSGTVTSAGTAQQSGTAVYAVSSGTAVYATTSGTALTISGSITKSQVSDFTSGTVASASTAQQSGTALFANTSGTATYATTSGTAVFATTSGTAVSISGSITRSQVSDFSSGTVASADVSGTATFATTSGTATYATTSGTAVFATNAGTAVTISGSIAQSQVTSLVTDLAGKASLGAANAFTVGGHVITNAAAAVVPLILKGASGQTGDLFQIQNNSGTNFINVNNLGSILFGSGSGSFLSGANGRVNVQLSDATAVGVTVRGAGGQTADLLQLQNSAAVNLFAVSSAGLITAKVVGNAANQNRGLLLSNTSDTWQSGLYLKSDSGGNPRLTLLAPTGALGEAISIDSAAKVGIGSTAPTAQLDVYSGAAARIGAVIRGAASQTADLLQVQNSAATVLSKLQADGGASFASGNATIGSGGIIRGTQVSTNVDYSSLREENSGGLLRLTKQTAVAANPAANQAKIYLRDGTTAGTLKLVVRAGAAGAETTILDNIPQ